ncbi:MAG: glycosyl hydrolase family 18 protein, partial [Candidatus Auribacterota bacterium]|nr:glycosyl hydrolase family 18 protein [Candidatus Auribacterota bacterium]
MKRLTEEAFAKLKLEKVNVEEKYAGSYNSKIKLEKKIKIYAENLKEIQNAVEEKELAEETRREVQKRIDEIQTAKKFLEQELKKVSRKKEYYEKEIANLRDKFKSDEVRITFKNGTSMIGKVLYQGRDKIKLKIQYGIIDINKEEVDKIDFVTYAEKRAEEAKVKDLKIYHFENNGVWLNITWINQHQDIKEIVKLRNFLRLLEIKNIFLVVKRDIGWSQSPAGLLFAGSFIKEMNRGNKNFEFYACLKGQTEFGEEPDTNLSRESDCRGIVDTVKGLCSEYPFDGILLDLAPVPNGNENYTSLIKELKKQVPSKKVSVVSMEWGSEGDIDVWDTDYYREVTSLADFIIVPCYDAYFENSDIYISWIDEQIIRISNITKCNFLIGVSTSKKTTEEHNPVVENFDNALVGIRSGLSNKGAN